MIAAPCTEFCLKRKKTVNHSAVVICQV